MWTQRCSGSIGSATFFAEVEAIFGGKSLEMDLGVQEYLKGEKHQLGRHVTMLLILIVMMIVVSTWCLNVACAARFFVNHWSLKTVFNHKWTLLVIFLWNLILFFFSCLWDSVLLFYPYLVGVAYLFCTFALTREKSQLKQGQRQRRR